MVHFGGRAQPSREGPIRPVLPPTSLLRAPKLQCLSGRRSDKRGTGRRQVAKPQWFSGRSRGWVKRLFGEPPIELLAAAVA